MSRTDKGVLIFGEWFEAMSNLDPKSYKAMMNAIYRYQQKGEQPPEFKGKASIIASIIFPCIDRRLAQSRGGKKAMEARRRGYGVNPIIDELLQKNAAAEPPSLDS